MNSFKDIAYQILKKVNKPLHSKEIVRIAQQKKLLKTKGKTPYYTMNASLITDIKNKKEKSRFVQKGPSRFSVNLKYKEENKPKKSERIILSEQFVKEAIIKYLSANGWGHFQFGGLHEHGVDIRARHFKYTRYYLIEAKGGQASEVSFVFGLGQIITRMNITKSTRYYYGLGLPEIAAKIALRRLPWQIAKKLYLIVLSVNADEEVEEYDWTSLKKIQGEK